MDSVNYKLSKQPSSNDLCAKQLLFPWRISEKGGGKMCFSKLRGHGKKMSGLLPEQVLLSLLSSYPKLQEQ